VAAMGKEVSAISFVGGRAGLIPCKTYDQVVFGSTRMIRALMTRFLI
jgi:hypothetical protein